LRAESATKVGDLGLQITLNQQSAELLLRYDDPLLTEKTIDFYMISLSLFGITNNALLAIVAALTGAALVFLAMWIAGLISPRSYNPQKAEAYECGIPTRGESMAQFRVGYYLFAILFLMFDVETVFLFPWAVIMKSLGVDGLISIAVFFGVLVLGLVYAWRKGALEWK
jgi:NADH-quinone oxidoreductase subunit A